MTVRRVLTLSRRAPRPRPRRRRAEDRPLARAPRARQVGGRQGGDALEGHAAEGAVHRRRPPRARICSSSTSRSPASIRSTPTSSATSFASRRTPARPSSSRPTSWSTPSSSATRCASWRGRGARPRGSPRRREGAARATPGTPTAWRSRAKAAHRRPRCAEARAMVADAHVNGGRRGLRRGARGGARGRRLLRRLVDAGEEIVRFERSVPTLHEIFVDHVRRHGAGGAAGWRACLAPWFVVARREYTEGARSRWFVFTCLLGPVLFAAIIGFTVWAQLRGGGKTARLVLVDETREAIGRDGGGGARGRQARARGSVSPSRWRPPRTDRGALTRRIDAGQLDGYLVLPADVAAGRARRLPRRPTRPRTSTWPSSSTRCGRRE